MNKDKLQLGLKRPMSPRTFVRIAIQFFVPHLCKIIFIDDTIGPQYKPREECNGKYYDNEDREYPKDTFCIDLPCTRNDRTNGTAISGSSTEHEDMAWSYMTSFHYPKR